MLSSCDRNPATTVTDQFERLNLIKAESIEEMRRRMRKVKFILRDMHQKKKLREAPQAFDRPEEKKTG